MRALLSDLDRTLTGADLRLDPAARQRIRDLRATGVRFVLVTGRALDHLVAMGLHHEVDALVAENGAAVVVPSRDVYELCDDGWAERARGAMGPLAARFHWGRAIASGPREAALEVSEALTRARVGHALSFNAEEVMVLPPGIDKAAGARRALHHLDLVGARTWGIGDGENDVPLLQMVEVAGAPANAHPAAAEAATIRLARPYAQGFLEFTEPLLAQAAARVDGKG